MLSSIPEEIILVLYVLFMIFYMLIFSYLIEVKRKRRIMLSSFYNAVCTIQSLHLPLEQSYKQLVINYKKLFQKNSPIKFLSILDLLETMIYYHDSYDERRFSKRLSKIKDATTRRFLSDVCEYIRQQMPFISVPQKERDLLLSAYQAAKSNNADLAYNSLCQLANEIESNKKIMIKKEKENKIAIIISILGIVFTVFFGLLTILPMINTFK